MDVVTGALGADTRVGRRCLKGGLGFAGPCFPRDNAAFQKVAADAGVELLLPPQVVRSNDSIVDYLFGVVAGRVGKGATIALLGFAYKPGTHITECSQSLKLMNRFLEADYRIAAHDPMAEVEIPHQHKDSVTVYDTPEEAVTAVEAVLLLTPWPEYGAIDWESLWKGLPHPIHFFDCWRVAKNAACAGDKVRYWALG